MASAPTWAADGHNMFASSLTSGRAVTHTSHVHIEAFAAPLFRAAGHGRLLASGHTSSASVLAHPHNDDSDVAMLLRDAVDGGTAR